MNSLDSLLDKIDLFFKDKKSSEIYLIFAMAFALIGFIFYSYLYPVTEKILNQSIKNSKEVEKKLHDEQAYLASVSKDGDATFLIKKVKSDIENSKLLLEKTIYSVFLTRFYLALVNAQAFL